MTTPRSKPWRTLCALAVLLVGIAPLVLRASVAPPDTNTGINHALIIGIGDYAQWDKLQGPPKDAEAIADLLSQKYNFSKNHITLLTDRSKEKPTLINIFTVLDRYKRELTANDNLLIFFSGHSIEDDEGETYWIPMDGKKNAKRTWLSHSDLSQEYFADESFKVKSLAIIADSVFSSKLVRTRTISLTPFDLRYGEKIREKATRVSREIIAFGDRHWPATAETDGLGLFAYYLRKALAENVEPIIDFENLVLDEKIIFPIGKIAGTRIIAGRLQTPLEKGGQFLIAKLAPAALPNVLDAIVQPEKGYQGEDFTFKAATSDPAESVALRIAGKELPMEGSGTQWQASLKIDQLGTTEFEIIAKNRNAEAGKTGRGKITTIKKMAELANVDQAAVTPAQGIQGDRFTFSTTTDQPAKSVAVVIDGQRKAMQGKDRTWTLATPIESAGEVSYRIVALNADDLEGRIQEGRLQIGAGTVEVTAVTTTPKTALTGEEFTISATTNLPAKSAAVVIDGQTYPMAGRDKQWAFKTTVDQAGEKAFSVTALNLEGKESAPATGALIAKASPLPIPEITTASVNVVAPGKGQAGDRFQIQATTSAPSEKAFLEINDQRLAMEGSGTDWRYVAKIDKLGESEYRIYALNKDGAQGKSYAGRITTTRPAAEPVNVVKVTASPETGSAGSQFSFTATTDQPARNVLLVIGKNRFPMTGSDRNWSLTRKIEEAGDLSIAMVALNEDEREGTPGTAALKVFRERYQRLEDGQLQDLISNATVERFVDNRDGTITDRYSSLMWLKEPKQIAIDFEGAEDYVRGLKMGSYGGWRLPTIAELKNLSDSGQQNPALPKGHPFENIVTHMTYWSKTKHKFALYMQVLNLWTGRAGQLKKAENGIVWPVRYVATESQQG